MSLPVVTLLGSWLRYRRIARAFDGARTIAEHIARGARVLDIGCGSGFIAYHLSALGRRAVGVDLGATTEAPIAYAAFDGRQLPFGDAVFDAAIFSFVLHHAADITALLVEARRVVRPGGRIIVYEDIPERWHDRLLCVWHDRRWRARTGPCTFLRLDGWQALFRRLHLRIAHSRLLPRLRNPTHPVRGALFVLEREVHCDAV